MAENYEIIKIIIGKIKDELLLFAVFSIFITVTFPRFKIYVFVIFIVASFLYSAILLYREYNKKSNNEFLSNFEKFLEEKNDWEKRTINDSDVFFYKKDNNYKIEQSNDIYQEWTIRESWMKNFPDSYISEWKVYLKHGENTVAEYAFLSCDGGRYFIPIPEKRCLEEDVKYSWKCNKFGYYWTKDSVEYKLGEVIGRFYREDSLNEVAKFCGIIVK